MPKTMAPVRSTMPHEIFLHTLIYEQHKSDSVNCKNTKIGHKIVMLMEGGILEVLWEEHVYEYDQNILTKF